LKIKKGLDISTGDFWYDLTDGGYLDPEKICANAKDAERVMEAIEIIKDFQKSCEEQIDNFVQ
jgi:hypothetical protein